MRRFARWVLIAVCLFLLVPLLAIRGGLGEYIRGGSLVTAHPGRCLENIDNLENGGISCSARWTTGGHEVQGTVYEVDPAGARAVDPGSGGLQYEVRFPDAAMDVLVFADASTARPAKTSLMAVGAGSLAALITLLIWEAVMITRHAAGRRPIARAV